MSTDDKTAQERLTKRLRHYRGFVFRWQSYQAHSPSWSHDHCGGCSTDGDHLRTKAYEAPSRVRPLVYRVGFAVLGCAFLFSAVALFFTMIAKPSKKSYDNVPVLFMAVVICGLLVWLAMTAFEETPKDHK